MCYKEHNNPLRRVDVYKRQGYSFFKKRFGTIENRMVLCYNFYRRKSTLRRKGAAMNGRFDFLVLHLLSKEKMYGFQIIKKLFDATDGEIEMKTGTLYPLLQTLENNGYIAASLVLINGRDRNVYQITEKGRIYLSEQKKRWIRYRTCLLYTSLLMLHGVLEFQKPV